jgi:hypothetical protein
VEVENGATQKGPQEYRRLHRRFSQKRSARSEEVAIGDQKGGTTSKGNY